jgi:hypothetical protein
VGQLSGPQRVVLRIAGLVVVIAAVIGFWPVSVAVTNGTSYSCGSGFVHSGHTWKVDTAALAGRAVSIDTSSATPVSACPSIVFGRRDLAYALVGFAFVGGAGAIALLQDKALLRDRPETRATRNDAGLFGTVIFDLWWHRRTPAEDRPLPSPKSDRPPRPI